MAGNSLPLQMTGEENWATAYQAEVDGISSSRGGLFGDGTVYVRMMFNVIQDHPVEPEKCPFCSRVDLTDTATGMRVLAMTPAIVAVKPYPWLA